MIPLLVAIVAASGYGQRIERVAPRGLRLDGSTRLTIDIKDLAIDRDARSISLLIDKLPIEATVISQVPSSEVPSDQASSSQSTGKLNLHVDLRSVPGALVPGIYPLRIVTPDAVSNPVLIGIDELRQVDLKRDSAEIATDLPVALHGELIGETIHEFQFLGQAGQRIFVDVEGQRLGSKLRPVLRLYAPTGRQLASARPTRRLAGDAQLQVVLPETGIYRVQLQDIVYKGPKPGWFRIKLGELSTFDAVFPLAIPTSGRHTLELVGERGVQLLPYNASANEQVGPRSIAQLAATQLSDADRQPFFHNLTGVMPRVHLTEWGDREQLESTAHAGPIELPIAINGRLANTGEIDEYRLHVTAGSKVQVELFADRWGSPLDGVVEVFHENGTSLGRGDDQPGTTDPKLQFTVPDNCSEVTVRVSSLTGQHGANQVYRMTARIAQFARSQIVLPHDSITVHAGSRWVGPLNVDHAGSPKQLHLSLHEQGNPIGMKVEPTYLESADEQPLIALSTTTLARGVFLVRVNATADGTDAMVVQSPMLPNHKQQPGLSDSQVVVVREPAPIDIIWVDTLDPLVRGSKRTTHVSVVRNSHDVRGTGPLRVSLLSSQKPRTREENKQQVLDPDRNLRLLESVVIEPNEFEAAVTMHVPNDLPTHAWSLALKAELLSADRESVQATVFSKIHQRNTISAVTLTYEPPETLPVVAGKPVLIRGSIGRHASFRQPVVVRLEGLGAEFDVSTVVGVDQDSFQLSLLFPEDKDGQIFSDVRLVAAPHGGSAELAGIKTTSKAFTVELTPSK